MGRQRRARDLDRPQLRAGRLRLELPGRAGGAGRASARSTPGTTSRSRPCASPEDLERDPVRYQGNWIPHRCAPPPSDGIFFAGDSAGHCLPLTAEGIRTALYFGIACGRELRAVVEGRKDRAAALRDYAAFSASHRWKFEAMLRVQRLVPRVEPRLLGVMLRGMERRSFVDWSFGHYLDIAPPEFAGASPPGLRRTPRLAAAA